MMGIRDLFFRVGKAMHDANTAPPGGGIAVKIARRSFDAGKQSGANVNWAGSNLSFDEMVYRNLRLMRARSRDLANNSPYMKRFLQLVQTHIVGPNGFKLIPQTRMENGKLDAPLNAAVTDSFKRWSRSSVCDIRRIMSFPMLCRVIVKTVARDGEALIRKVASPAANEFGFGLQLVSIDRLDIELNRDLGGGAIIRMGVEMASSGEPIAYHLLTRHPGDRVSRYGGKMYERVPASQIKHMFLPIDPEQTRGVPWAHAAMINLENLGGFDEAAVIAARIGASKMGYIESPDGDGEEIATGTFGDGTLAEDMEPGQINTLPPGWQFKGWDPAYPSTAYDPFTRACIRGVSAGLGVSYNSLSNDLENVNFSSIRSGVLEDRDQWVTLQNWFEDMFLSGFWNDWSRFALLTGQIQIPGRLPIPVSRVDRIARGVIWQGRRWQWVDPFKDVQTAEKSIAAGLTSRRRVAAAQGVDLDEVWMELKQEKEQADEMGLDFETKADSSAPDKDASESDEPDEGKADDNKDK